MEYEWKYNPIEEVNINLKGKPWCEGNINNVYNIENINLTFKHLALFF